MWVKWSLKLRKDIFCKYVKLFPSVRYWLLQPIRNQPQYFFYSNWKIMCVFLRKIWLRLKSAKRVFGINLANLVKYCNSAWSSNHYYLFWEALLVIGYCDGSFYLNSPREGCAFVNLTRTELYWAVEYELDWTYIHNSDPPTDVLLFLCSSWPN